MTLAAENSEGASNSVAGDASRCRSLRHAHTGKNATMGGGAFSTGDVAGNFPGWPRGRAAGCFCRGHMATADDEEGAPSFLCLWMGKKP
ncbi:hypothetical protein VIGAN_03120800 [Vigna angularis var. angularis]|uniref:Uncharacterized protein n=1 Tax=Vigna angularis var. angularis TaxID=157739 RepID=A0A0S3RLI4_PHAAN|nr:hypothetical protein VIGAN_03120800 [Vigna angularis var. angularis]